MSSQYLVKRDAIHEGKFVTNSETARPGENQVLLEISQFAFTANNVTYALMGERMGYWQFFPSNEEGWGIIPVWGFATVAESNHPDIQSGERIYGYLPMARHLIVTPDSVSPHGFTDSATHRQALSPIYNSYVRADANEDYEKSFESINSLLRPMFTTSFLLDDFFFDNAMFGASTIILSSASSKTAYGTAFLLNANRENRPEYKIIGLTSPANVQFVESLGCYDEVLVYEDTTNLDASEKAVYIDFSGNQALRKTIHEHYQDNLLFDSAVGATHWTKAGSAKNLPGAEVQLFFAPSQLEKRLKEWGRSSYQEQMTGAWLMFIYEAKNWMDITEIKGQDEVAKLYQDMVSGKAKPEKGYMLSF